jgi:1-acyl-sn-glycerol-3-phosphate acyltransferase
MTSSTAIHEFDDIRPYHDGEVRPVMQRLMADPELADTLVSMKHPRAPRWLRPFLRPFVRRILHREFDAIDTVRQLQELIGVHMRAMLRRTGTDFSVSGIEHVAPGGAYLFVSNHRDIAMDPAFVNLALDEHGRDTVRIAIGDNLLTKPFTSDLIRLNKSFIVKRSVTGRREKFKALTSLSRYIRHSILEDHSNVWIAQREGRAKNGIDRTETALIKMLTLGRPKDESFGDAIARLNIVPVAISYQFDPCDLDKARELYAWRTTGAYEKGEHEDLASIYKGIVGDKGRVHVAFGEPLPAGFGDDEDVAAYLDNQIITHYRLQATNLIAWEKRHGRHPEVDGWKAALDCDWGDLEARLMARVAGEPAEVRDIFLDSYANPVQSRLDLIEH